MQFIPILEDRYYVQNVFDNNNEPTDAWAVKYGQLYQQWFYDKLIELSTFLGHGATPLPGCKRHIFSVFVENDELKKDGSDIGSWMTENAPLFYLHVKFEGSKNKSATLSKIEIKSHNNCEVLGFNLYGNAEVLYGIERFYTEYITFYEEMRVVHRDVSSHHLRPFALGTIQQYNFIGEWGKSKAATGDDAKFAAGWNEYMYKVVDLYDDKDIYDKVRTKYYRDRLKIEAKGQLDRVMAWNATNKYAVGLKFDAT